MSVKKTLAVNNDGKPVKRNVTYTNSKRRRFNQCFSFKEVSVEPVSSLNDLDSKKFKGEIRRWAKAVVAYASQVSGSFGSPRSNNLRHGSSGSSYHIP